MLTYPQVVDLILAGSLQGTRTMNSYSTEKICCIPQTYRYIVVIGGGETLNAELERDVQTGLARVKPYQDIPGENGPLPERKFDSAMNAQYYVRRSNPQCYVRCTVIVTPMTGNMPNYQRHL